MNLELKQQAQIHYDTGTRILQNLSHSSSICEDLKNAVKHLQKATELNPNFTFAFHNLAHAWYNLAEYNIASAGIQGFRANPQETENNIKSCLECALNAVDKAIAIQNRFSQAHNTRAMILAKLFRLNEAKEAIEIALSQNPEYGNAKNNRIKIEEIIIQRAQIPGYKDEAEFLQRINQNIAEQQELWEKLWKK